MSVDSPQLEATMALRGEELTRNMFSIMNKISNYQN